MSTSSELARCQSLLSPLDSKTSDKEIKAQVGVEGPILPLLAGPQRLASRAWVSRAGVLERRPTGAQGPPLVHQPPPPNSFPGPLPSSPAYSLGLRSVQEVPARSSAQQRRPQAVPSVL